MDDRYNFLMGDMYLTKDQRHAKIVLKPAMYMEAEELYDLIMKSDSFSLPHSLRLNKAIIDKQCEFILNDVTNEYSVNVIYELQDFDEFARNTLAPITKAGNSFHLEHYDNLISEYLQEKDEGCPRTIDGLTFYHSGTDNYVDDFYLYRIEMLEEELSLEDIYKNYLGPIDHTLADRWVFKEDSTSDEDCHHYSKMLDKLLSDFRSSNTEHQNYDVSNCKFNMKNLHRYHINIKYKHRFYYTKDDNGHNVLYITFHIESMNGMKIKAFSQKNIQIYDDPDESYMTAYKTLNRESADVITEVVTGMFSTPRCIYLSRPNGMCYGRDYKTLLNYLDINFLCDRYSVDDKRAEFYYDKMIMDKDTIQIRQNHKFFSKHKYIGFITGKSFEKPDEEEKKIIGQYFKSMTIIAMIDGNYVIVS